MEVEAFQECWKEESLTFVREEFYESIQAPKWFDFTLPVPEEPLIDDNAWFCVRVGCDQKHGMLLDQTPKPSYLLKPQASKSVGFLSKSPTMEGKCSVRPRLRAQLSTPTSKGKDRTPGKAKPTVMSASKLRHKQCEENEDPNSTDIGTLNCKLVVIGAEGLSSLKPSSNTDGLDSLKENPAGILTGEQVVPASDINLTPQNQSINKVTTAFSTPRIKKNHSVKREPFRSNPALSKGTNTAARSKAAAPRRILFETPTKSVKKTPSKDLTPVRKHFSNPKKHEQFAANDNKYSSPAKETPRVCLTPCSLQPSESPLSKVHNSPSSSKPKDSRKARNHLRSNRKVLVSEQSNEKESLTRAIVQETDLVQGKVGSTCTDGGCSQNQSSIKQSHTGNNDEQNPPIYPGETSKEGNSNLTGKHESRTEEQYVAQLASIIPGKRLTYGISEIEIQKASESYGAEESTSNQDEGNGVEFFKDLRKGKENKNQNHSDGKIEIANLEVRQNDDQSKFDEEADDHHLEMRGREAEMNLTTENRVARELTLIKNSLPSELVSNLQNESDGKNEKEILKDKKNDDERIQYVMPIDGSLQEKEKNDGSASESVLSGRNIRVIETTAQKTEFDVKHNEQNLGDGANKFVMCCSAAENKGSDAENSIIIWMGSESESKLEVDSDQRAETKTEDGKLDGKDALDVRHNDNNLKERKTEVMNSGTENQKVGEVLTLFDFGHTRAMLETGVVVESSKFVSKAMGKRDHFYLKNKQNLKENEDHVIFDEEHDIRGTKEGKAGEAIQLESDLKFQSKRFHKDVSSDSRKCLEVIANVAVQCVKEDNSDSMQKIDKDDLVPENGENVGLSCNKLKDHTIKVDISDSGTCLSEVNHQVHLVGNEIIKADVCHTNCLETFEDYRHGGSNCLQSKPDRSSQLFISGSLCSEVVCQLPRNRDETPQIAELKKNEEIGLFDRDCFPHSKSDGAVGILAVADCAVNKENLSTPSKGEKRTSGEMNSKINCSNGEACQDDSCCMAFSTCQTALPTKVYGTSTPHAFNHKKIKPTLPKPFRLRTAERGERKENSLHKRTQVAEENETSPMRAIRANKMQGNHSHIDPSKHGKPETPKSHEGKLKSRPRNIDVVKAKMLDDIGEEIKSIPEEALHHRPVVKMPNFCKPPFKPMRSTKKLTTPKEPNFHPMHSKRDCTKGVESSVRAAV